MAGWGGARLNWVWFESAEPLCRDGWYTEEEVEELLSDLECDPGDDPDPIGFSDCWGLWKARTEAGPKIEMIEGQGWTAMECGDTWMSNRVLRTTGDTRSCSRGTPCSRTRRGSRSQLLAGRTGR